TMVNGLGVLGWGVGGIEAEAAMLGQPTYLPWPVVVGVRLHGALPTGTTATDLVLTLTELFRKHGVVDKFIEFAGDGLASLRVEDAGGARDGRSRGGGAPPAHRSRERGLRRHRCDHELHEHLEPFSDDRGGAPREERDRERPGR